MKMIYFKKYISSQTYIGLNKKLYTYVFLWNHMIETFHMELKYNQLTFNTGIGIL